MLDIDRLISLAPAKRALGSGSGSAACCILEGSVGENFLGELLLGLCETSTRPSVLRVDLGKSVKENILGQ